MLNWTRPPTAQATYTVDGRCVMDLDAHANYIGRGIIQLIFQIICQAPRDLVMRSNCMSIFNAITYINSHGKCVRLEDWPEMPGWAGKDVALGTAYTPNLSSEPPEYLNKLFNSDDLDTPFPFGRSELGQFNGFDKLCKKQVPSIPQEG